MQSSLVLVLLGQWSFAFHRLCSPSLPAASTHPTKLFPVDPNSVLVAAWATGSAHCSSSVPACSCPRWAKCSLTASFTLPPLKDKISTLLSYVRNICGSFLKIWQSRSFFLAPSFPTQLVFHWKPACMENQQLCAWRLICLHVIAWTATTKPRVTPAKQQSSPRIVSGSWFLSPVEQETQTQAGFFWDRESTRSMGFLEVSCGRSFAQTLIWHVQCIGV